MERGNSLYRANSTHSNIFDLYCHDIRLSVHIIMIKCTFPMISISRYIYCIAKAEVYVTATVSPQQQQQHPAIDPETGVTALCVGYVGNLQEC